MFKLDIYTYTYSTVIFLEDSIIITTKNKNIYICTVRKSTHNNHKLIYS